jgi:hypothetical protein
VVILHTHCNENDAVAYRSQALLFKPTIPQAQLRIHGCGVLKSRGLRHRQAYHAITDAGVFETKAYDTGTQITHYKMMGSSKLKILLWKSDIH